MIRLSGSYRHGKQINENPESIFQEEIKMRKHYNFSKAIKNPYSKRLKTQITIRIEDDVIEYFKNLALQEDIPYQKLINLFLRDCAQNQKRPLIKWTPEKMIS